MGKVYEMVSRSTIDDEAGDWIAMLDRGLSLTEKKTFDDWLAADPRNLDTLLELAALWDRMDSLTLLADLFPQPVSSSRTRFAPVLSKVAAMAAAVIVGFGLWHFAGDDADLEALSPRVPPPAENDYFETAIGEQSTVNLADGSTLTLNTNSAVRVRYSAALRGLILDRGEVHVRVAKDPSRPLNVHVGKRVVQAIGTEFNVQFTDDRRVELIVTEGKVLVHGPEPVTRTAANRSGARADRNSIVAVSAGQQAIFGVPDERIEKIEADEIETRLSWQAGNLIFRGESLADAIDEVERYTSIDLVILDDDLKNVRVAGLFKAGDIDGLLNTLQENFSIEHRVVDGQRIVLTGH